MTNPLLSMFARTDELQNSLANFVDDPDHEAKMDAVGEQWATIYNTGNANDRRLARVALRGMNAYEESYDSIKGNHGLTELEAFSQFTDSPFEAAVLSLAHHWSNDLIDNALHTLGIDTPHFNGSEEEREARSIWWETIVKPAIDAND